MRTDIEMDVGRSPLTVVLAEKSPIARAALAAVMTCDGYRVFPADSSKAAISHMNNVGDLAVLLADLDMPEWRSIVRHAAETTDALIIGVKGDHPFSDMYDLSGHGINVTLQKPFTYEDVRMVISENIQHSESVRHGVGYINRLKAA